MSFVRSREAVASWRLVLHAKINRCFCVCPLEGVRPLLGGSVMGGSTVLFIESVDSISRDGPDCPYM